MSFSSVLKFSNKTPAQNANYFRHNQLISNSNRSLETRFFASTVQRVSSKWNNNYKLVERFSTLATAPSKSSSLFSKQFVHKQYQVQQRNFFPFFRNNAKRLEDKANANATDPAVQAQLFTELSNLGRFQDILKRFESGKFAIDDNVRREYAKILQHLKIFQVQQGGVQTPFPSNGVHKVQLVTSSSSKIWNFISSFALLMLALSAIVFIYVAWTQLSADQKRGGGGPFSISNAHQEVERVETKFVDVKGCDEAKQELVQIVEYLKDPSKFTRLGARPPKGVLLVGEPGTGKTLLARALAGEAQVPFLYCTGSSFDELYVGVGPRRIKNLFEDAKRLAPCIIFIDEIDSVGGSRKYSSYGSSSREATLNQLLTELDGFKTTQGIIVVGATNFPESLDAAIVRPGRFDKQVSVPVPDLKGRKEIIEYYLKKVTPDPSLDSLTIARGTYGFTGADIANLVNIAATRATIQGKQFVDDKSIEEAKDEIIMGLERRSDQDPMQKKITAYHEGGHTIVALYTPSTAPLHKATIIQRGSALGVTVRLPESDMPLGTRKQLIGDLAISMGGRAAESLIFGEEQVTGGASSDIKSATQTALRMVTSYGMSDKIGMVHHDLSFDSKVQVSNSEREMVDAEVKEIIKTAYTSAKKILSDHEEELHRLAKALLEYETLSAEEIKQVISGKPLNKAL